MTFAYASDIGISSYREIEDWVLHTLAPDLGLSIGSDYRPGAVTVNGNISLHARKNAVDFVGSAANMVKLAARLETYHPYILEMEHSGGGPRAGKPEGYWVKNGDIVGPDRYGPVNVSQHYNHVHLAMTLSGLNAARQQGGVPAIGISTAGGGGSPCKIIVFGALYTLGDLLWTLSHHFPS